MSKPNRFDFLKERRTELEAEQIGAATAPEHAAEAPGAPTTEASSGAATDSAQHPPTASPTKRKPVAAPEAVQELAPELKPEVPEPGRQGRPRRGKRSDPNYLQFGFYLPREMHKKLKLIALAEDLEVSELVESALSAWLQKRDTTPA